MMIRLLQTALVATAAIGLLPMPATAQMYGLSPEEMRQLQEFQQIWNSLDPQDRAGIVMPDAEELARRGLETRGKQCYSTQYGGMVPCELVWNAPSSPGASVPSFGGMTSGGSAPIPEPQLGVRSPAYRNLAAQISDQFGRYDDEYEQTRAFLMSFEFEPWIASAVDQTPCASAETYPACEQFPEFFDCEFDGWCTAYWANEAEDVYLAIVVRAGTGRWVPHSPSIMRADTAEWRQISTMEIKADQRDREADSIRRSEEMRQQGIEAMERWR